MTETGDREREEDPGADERGRQDRRVVAQTPYDPGSDRSLTAALVAAVAEAEDIAPTEVGPPALYESVDVAAIEDALFRVDDVGTDDTESGRVEFEYEGYAVAVTGSGWIQVAERA
jgi:hypothetical protein